MRAFYGFYLLFLRKPSSTFNGNFARTCSPCIGRLSFCLTLNSPRLRARTQRIRSNLTNFLGLHVAADCMGNLGIAFIGAGAGGNFVGMQRTFCPNFLKFSRKTFMRQTLYNISVAVGTSYFTPNYLPYTWKYKIDTWNLVLNKPNEKSTLGCASCCQHGNSHLAEVGLTLLPSLKTHICGIYHIIFIMTMPWVAHRLFNCTCPKIQVCQSPHQLSQTRIRSY